jgi:hypothetical protein
MRIYIASNFTAVEKLLATDSDVELTTSAKERIQIMSEENLKKIK